LVSFLGLTTEVGFATFPFDMAIFTSSAGVSTLRRGGF
jgi:hypothetical protein